MDRMAAALIPVPPRFGVSAASLALAALLFAGPGAANDEPCDADTPCETSAPIIESPGRARIAGLDELRFNPAAGQFSVSITGARLASDPDDVQVFVNNQRLPAELVSLSRHAIDVDYRFDAALNEVLVTAPDAEGRRVRADGLYWAGDLTLVVDVTDSLANPIDGVPVTVRLGQASTVRATARTSGGTVRFANLPDATVIVEAGESGGSRTSVAIAASAGPLLLVIETERDRAAEVSTSDQ